MSSFTEPLVLQPIPRAVDRWGNPIYETTRDFSYHRSDHSKSYFVPWGSRTNLATVPWGFRWLFPEICKLDGRAVQCAVLHDHLVSEFSNKTPPVERSEAHEVFLEAMLVMGMPRCKIPLIKVGLKIGDIYYHLSPKYASIRAERKRRRR